MAFPTTQLPATAWIAPGSNPVDGDTWVWEEITDDVRVADGIQIAVGKADEASTTDAGKAALTLDNRSGNYSPRNPLGTWYGSLRRNTPLQLRYPVGSDTFTRTVSGGWGTSSGGGTWSHSGGFSSSFTTNGSVGVCTFAASGDASYSALSGAVCPDATVVYSAAMPVMPTGAAWVSAVVFRETADNQSYYRMHTEFQADGTIRIKVRAIVDGAGSDLVALTDTGVTFTAGAKIWTRAECNGADLRIRCWADGDPEPSTWHGSVRDGQVQGTTIKLLQWRLATNVGSLAINIDNLTVDALLFTGLVSEWPPRWDQSGNDCTATVTANGITRRLSQGQSPVQSPIYRQLAVQSPQGYWPLEDGSDVTTASSALTGGLVAASVDVTFGSDDHPGGATAAAVLNTAGSSKLYGRVAVPATTPDGYAGMCYVKLGVLPGSTTAFLEFTTTGTVVRWVISAGATTFQADGYDSSGTSVVSTGGVYVIDPTQWTAIQLETEESGGNVDWSLIWHQVGADDFWAINGTYAGTADRIVGFTATAPVASTGISNVWLGDNDLPFVDSTFALVSNGYSGELASDRVQRLCDEQGVPVQVAAGSSTLMGPQRNDTFLNLLRAVEEADQGWLYERGAGLAYRPLGALYNRTSVMTLDVASGHIAAPPEPTDDDQQLRNDWTLSRDNGGSAHIADDTHVAEFGRYDSSLQVNIASDVDLPYHAGWRVHLGTVDELRWPSIQVDLARNATLIPTWLTVGVGDRITVTNPPDQVLGDDIDLIIDGYAQKLTPFGWDVTLTCSPASPWTVAVADDGDLARADTAGSELASSCTDVATSLSVATTDGPIWSTSTTFPFDIRCGGEVMTVAAISGGSSPQTFTVTRSVNGVVAAHAAGTTLSLAYPARAAL